MADDCKFFNKGSYDEVRAMWGKHGVQFKKTRPSEPYASLSWDELAWLLAQREPEPESESEFAW